MARFLVFENFKGKKLYYTPEEIQRMVKLNDKLDSTVLNIPNEITEDHYFLKDD